MKTFFWQTSIIFLLAVTWFPAYTQTNRFLQIEVNGGLSRPIGSFSDVHMFAGQGIHAGGGFDYFFNKVGFGFTAGYFTNESESLFNSYIVNKYYESPQKSTQSSWNSKYILVGPTVKLTAGKFEFDFYAKGGGSQIIVPDLLFNKRFFNQSYEVYHFTGTSKDWQFAWSGGTKVIFKINHWLGIQANAQYFATNYLSKIDYDYTYRNATDGNRNGRIEDSEYFEAQKINKVGSVGLSVLNLNMGLVFQLGKSEQKPVKMITEVFEPTVPETVVTDQPQPEQVPTKNDVIIEEGTAPVVESLNPKQQTIENEIPIVNANEEVEAKNAEEERLKLEPVNIPATTYDAPEAQYDAEAAEFLYKAGESYFATNDYENALPCFNKLKSDPKYPRAKYMFALSLCAMGNCNEGKREYKDFAKSYKEQDSRTLEIIFASQFEKCAQANKKKDTKATNNNSSPKVTNATINVAAKPEANEYRIQFIAMKKPNATFPGVSKVGTIETEFFPNKSVYRYTLLGYDAVEKAAEDLTKVRKMGFRDAFIAIYENGKRVNTIYHKR